MDPNLLFTITQAHQCTAVRVGRSPVLMVQGCCNQQAQFNKTHAYANIDPPLKLVAGSLGIGRPEEDLWFEYGGASCKTVIDFRRLPVQAPGTVDAHVWLEDGGGRVWDVVTPLMVYVARAHKKGLDYLPMRIVEGENKDVLAAHGLVYVAAEESERLVQEVARTLNLDGAMMWRTVAMLEHLFV